ncbi:hypothetical protein BD289DRAFT_36690 [Coniella lustricola]|uniref:Uncharacterized protein n=1 Tax=Coniella lustricola TaxID=2025994 RepID=A0A2T3AIL7_9PEZI|nr:hypothetical protein BD289DRAFT_36690 [Coniella lustricola]
MVNSRESQTSFNLRSGTAEINAMIQVSSICEKATEQLSLFCFQKQARHSYVCTIALEEGSAPFIDRCPTCPRVASGLRSLACVRYLGHASKPVSRGVWPKTLFSSRPSNLRLALLCLTSFARLNSSAATSTFCFEPADRHCLLLRPLRTLAGLGVLDVVLARLLSPGHRKAHRYIAACVEEPLNARQSVETGTLTNDHRRSIRFLLFHRHSSFRTSRSRCQLSGPQDEILYKTCRYTCLQAG